MPYRAKMSATLLLDRDPWDLALDASGNIAMATDPYSQVQDAASAVRVFEGECYYDTAQGVPYWTDVLGRRQPTQIMRARSQMAAMTVPGVLDAVAILTPLPNRTLGGQIQIRTEQGEQVISL